MLDDLLLHNLPSDQMRLKGATITLSGPVALAGRDVGKRYLLMRGALTLPDPLTCPVGSRIEIKCRTDACSINVPSGLAGIRVYTLVSMITIPFDRTDWVVLYNNGSQWELQEGWVKNIMVPDLVRKLPYQQVTVGRLYTGNLDQTLTNTSQGYTGAFGFAEVSQYVDTHYRRIGYFNKIQGDQGGYGFAHLQIQVDNNWMSDGNQILNLYFANRGIFDYWWTIEDNFGDYGNVDNYVSVQAYAITGSSGTMDDGTIEIWLCIPKAYVSLAWNFDLCRQFTVADSAYGTPSGTLVFDSSQPTNYPPLHASISDSAMSGGTYRTNRNFFGQLVGAVSGVATNGTGAVNPNSNSAYNFYDPDTTNKTFTYKGGFYRQTSSAGTAVGIDATPTASGGTSPDNFSVRLNGYQMLKFGADYNHTLNGNISIIPVPSSGTTAVTITTAASNQTDQWFLAAQASGGSDNKFVLRNDGNGFCDGAWTGGGADYAEYFEWKDGNPNGEDRRGWSVVVNGDKIRQAVAGEVPFGVISANPCVVGDAGWNIWKGKYLLDDFGEYIMETAEFWSWYEDVPVTQKAYKKVQTGTVPYTAQNDDGTTTTTDMPLYESVEYDEVIRIERTRREYFADQVPTGVVVPEDKAVSSHTRPKLNPDYTPDEEYVPRSQRKEWALVGFLGKLRVLNTQVVNPKWIKLTTISDKVDLYLVAAG